MPIQIHLLPLFPGILFPGSCVCLCAIFKMPVANRSHSLKSSGAIFFVGPSPLLVLAMGIAALLLLFAGTTQPVQAVPVPMPFRRFFFLSAANPTMLGAPAESQPIAPSAAHQSLADAEVERLMEGGEGISVQQHNQKPSQHSSRAALRGRVPMGPFDQVFHCAHFLS